MSKRVVGLVAHGFCALLTVLLLIVLCTFTAYADNGNGLAVVENAGEEEVTVDQDGPSPTQEVEVSNNGESQQTDADTIKVVSVQEESASDKDEVSARATESEQPQASQLLDDGQNVEITSEDVGLTTQATTNPVNAFIYKDGRLVIGKDLSRNNMFKGWTIGRNGVIFDQWEQHGTNPNPWNDYRDNIKSIEVVSDVKVTNAFCMFQGLNETTADVSRLDVSSCSQFGGMFYGNFELKSLDMSGWKMDKDIVDPADNMFYLCENLQTVKVGYGFVFPDELPESNVNGHTDWLSVKDAKWYSAKTIYNTRSGIADTYRKTSSINVSELKIRDMGIWYSWPIEHAGKKAVRDGSLLLTEGKHYVIKYPKYHRVGTVTATLYGIGIYSGSRSIPVRISPCPMYNLNIAHIDSEWWNGGVHTPMPVRPLAINGITLSGLSDYWVTYENNDRPGIGKAKFHGKGNFTGTAEETFIIDCKVGVKYRTHVQKYGWQNYVYNGSMSGTSGKSKRLEGINIELTNPQGAGGIRYRTHVQRKGWQDWRYDGKMSGTSGKSLRLEAIQIELTGGLATYYDVYYRVHCQRFGWMGWAKNGERSGSAGYSRRLEGIQVVLVKKGDPAPCATLKDITQRYNAPFMQKGKKK